MKSLNHTQLIGHLGCDPEFKENNGKMVAKFSVATGEEWLDKVSAEKVKNTEWHKVVCFNKLAEIVAKYLKKGSKVYVSGKLKTSTWQDQQNEKKSSTEIIVDDLMMLDGK
jgi:single-strand DNA-binding protein